MDFLKSTEFGGKLRNSEALRTLVRRLLNQISIFKLLVLVSLCVFRMTMTFIVPNLALT